MSAYTPLVSIVGAFSARSSLDGIVRTFSIKRDDVDCLFQGRPKLPNEPQWKLTLRGAISHISCHTTAWRAGQKILASHSR